MTKSSTPTGQFRNIFRCTGSGKIGASMDGALSLVEVIEVSGKTITIAFPPEVAAELANRFLAAADVAESRKRAQGMPETGNRKASPGPVVTDHEIQVSDDANTLVLTFRTGTTPLTVQVSESRSAKLRASLEKGETDLVAKKKRITN